MAILVAVGGAALGSAVGIGWSAGWLIGSIIGTLLFPTSSNTTVEGSRLGDLSVTSSAYGASIGICYGSVRTSGNMIWSTGIEEVRSESKQSSGGKGGGGASTTTVTYTYYSTFAIAFCEGIADDVLRMWCDGKLVYDKTGSGDDITKVNLKFRFYGGSETQNPDSLIVADQGEALTPAFRGLCYIVFDRLPLEDFGNRVPNITAELTFNGASEHPYIVADAFTVAEGGIAGSFQTDEILPDYDRGVCYTIGHDAARTRVGVIRRFNLRTLKEDRQSNLGLSDSAGLCGITSNGYLVVNSTASNSRPIHLVDPNTLKIVDTFGYSSSSLTSKPTNIVALQNSLGVPVQTGQGSKYMVLGSIFAHMSVFDVSSNSLVYVWDSDTFGNDALDDDYQINGVAPGAVGEGFCEAFYIPGPRYTGANSLNIKIRKLVIQDGARYIGKTTDDGTTDKYGTCIGVTDSLLASFTPGEIIPGETQLYGCEGLWYDETDDSVMLFVQANSGSQPWYIVKVNSSGSIVWRTQVPDGPNGIMGLNYSRVSNGIFGWGVSTRAFAIYTTSGELFYQDTGWTSNLFGTYAQWWDGQTNTFTGNCSLSPALGKWYFFRGNGGGASLDDIVLDICERVGLDSTDIDVSDLSDIEVPGYIISRQSSARSLIEQLAGVYLFDGIESDYTLKFLLRDGKSVSATIPQQDLALLDEESGEFFKETRTQEVELPLRLTLTYMDKDNDYQQQAHSAKRILNPTPTMSSRNELSKEVAIALDSTTAKQVAEKILFAAWIEKTSYAMMLPWKYLALDPADVVSVELDSGATFRVRLVQTDVGAGLSIDTSALSEDEAQYTSTTTAYGGEGPLAQEFLSDTMTKLILLGTPLLRDSDDSGGAYSRLYYLMGGYGQSGWQSAVLYKSAEGTEYAEAGAAIAEVTWGTASTKLEDTDGPFATDYANTVTVFLNTNTDTGLASATELETLNGANAAALINSAGQAEVFQFQTATLNDDGSYTLSGLLRGRRGTEWATGLHSVGDVFVLLESATGYMLDLALSELNVARYYKGATSGKLLEETDTTAFTSEGNDLKPYAPVHLDLSGTWGSDLTLTWVRRTRLGGALQDGLSVVPLIEETEAYEVDILFGDTVVRTIYSLSTTSATYTAAQQATDFPGGAVDMTSRLTNPSFEEGNTRGWTASFDTATAVQSGTQGNITAAQSGTYFFSMEEIYTGATEFYAYQDFDLSPWAFQVDHSNVQLILQGYIACKTNDTDTARIEIVWLNKEGETISTSASAETEPPSDGTWSALSVTATAPADARTARLKINGTRNNGSYTQVCWDNITLSLDEGTKESVNFVVYQMSSAIGRGFASVTKTAEV